MIRYKISEEIVLKAVDDLGMRDMTRGDLSAVIARHRNSDKFSAHVIVTAARGQRFIRRVMGWT